MTIEEYAEKLEIEKADAEKAVNLINDFDEKTASYYKGQVRAYEDALALLMEVENDRS